MPLPKRIALEGLTVRDAANSTRELRKLYSDSNVDWGVPKWFRTFYNRRLRRKHKSEVHYGRDLTPFIRDVKYDYF